MDLKLGAGSFGTVNKVVHRATKIERAMKTISKASIIKEDK